MQPAGIFSRRRFFQALAITSPALALIRPGLLTAQAQPRSSKRIRELKADVVICGGGLGGCAAGLAAARHGLKVILTEETDWIGGQLTAQAVPPAENPWIESFGATRSYQRVRRGIRDYYRRNYPLTQDARETELMNPGNGWVSKLCHEPRVALAALQELLAPHVSAGRIQILLRHQGKDALVDHDRIEAIRVRSLQSTEETVLYAPWYVDATETGELLPLAKVEYVSGSESRKRYWRTSCSRGSATR